jgi:hypothetical protein
MPPLGDKQEDAAPRGVQKLDPPCKSADSVATADVTAYRVDHAEKLRG